jgi:hypothetical protein
MSTEAQELEQIVGRAQQLSPEYRLRLIQQVAQTLIETPPEHHRHNLVYGKFSGAHASTLEDFAIAEWRPTDTELDG